MLSVWRRRCAQRSRAVAALVVGGPSPVRARISDCLERRRQVVHSRALCKEGRMAELWQLPTTTCQDMRPS